MDPLAEPRARSAFRLIRRRYDNHQPITEAYLMGGDCGPDMAALFIRRGVLERGRDRGGTPFYVPGVNFSYYDDLTDTCVGQGEYAP